MFGRWLLLCTLLGLMVLFAAAVQRWDVEKLAKLKGRRVGDKWIFDFSDGTLEDVDLFWLAALDPEHEG